MNTSLQDGYNIGWKLASVLKKQSHPDLLKTYRLERGKVAADLIAFDRDWARTMSSKAAKTGDGQRDDLRQAFIKAGRYTAGLTAKYDDSEITSAANSTQSLAPALEVGMRLPSAQVVRFCDAKAMQLVKALPSDGRWRVVIFAGDIRNPMTAQKLSKVGCNCLGRFEDDVDLVQLGKYLDSSGGPLRRYMSSTNDIDSFIEPIVVLHGSRVEIEQDQIPDVFWPVTGEYRMRGEVLPTIST